MILEYLSYDFVIYALIAGMLVALCSSLLGVVLVLKRYSFIGDGLSHVAFGAMAIAAVLSVASDMIVTIPVTIVVAILLLKSGQNARVKGDAALAMLSVGAMALGYVLLNAFGASTNIAGDVCSSLFGSTSIITLKSSDVLICAIMSVVVISFFIYYYNTIFALSFDENFAKATGTNTELFNTFIAIISAVTIVIAMKLVGAILVSAIIVFPCMTSMNLFKSFKNVVICSACYAVVTALAGILLSMVFSTPVGATIVIVEAAVYLISLLLRKTR